MITTNGGSGAAEEGEAALEGCLAELEAGAGFGFAGDLAEHGADLVLDLDHVAFLVFVVDRGAQHEACGAMLDQSGWSDVFGRTVEPRYLC